MIGLKNLTDLKRRMYRLIEVLHDHISQHTTSIALADLAQDCLCFDDGLEREAHLRCQA